MYRKKKRVSDGSKAHQLLNLAFCTKITKCHATHKTSIQSRLSIFYAIISSDYHLAGDLEFENSRFDGMPDKSGSVMNIKLLHQVGAMGIDGSDAEEQSSCDFSVGVTLRDKLEDLHFPSR